MNADAMFDVDKLADAFNGVAKEGDFKAIMFIKESMDVTEDCNTAIEESFGKGMVETITDWWKNVTTKKEFRELRKVQEVLKSLDELVKKLADYKWMVLASCGTDVFEVPKEIIETMDIFKIEMKRLGPNANNVTSSNRDILPKYHKDAEYANKEAMEQGVSRALETGTFVKNAIVEQGKQLTHHEEMFKNLIAVVNELCQRQGKMKCDKNLQLLNPAQSQASRRRLIDRLSQPSVPD